MSHDDIARLCTKLVVPVAVGDILHAQRTIGDDIQYGLHESLSEMDPDTALLAIAISAQHIALRYTPQNMQAIALALEAEKIVDDYGPDWLDHTDNRAFKRSEQAIYDLLQHVPEDLALLADMLGALQRDLDEVADPAWLLCDILALQARAHVEIAEFIQEESQRSSSQSALSMLNSTLAPFSFQPGSDADPGLNLDKNLDENLDMNLEDFMSTPAYGEARNECENVVPFGYEQTSDEECELPRGDNIILFPLHMRH